MPFNKKNKTFIWNHT